MDGKQTLIKKLKNYGAKYPLEKKLSDDFIKFIGQNENCFHRTNTVGHITGSALIIDELGRVLLLHHRKLGIWVQPGGHSDGDPNPLEVALRESEEETGLADLVVLDEEIFDIDLHLIPGKKAEAEHLHYDIRFIFKTKAPELIQKNDESTDLKWFDCGELAKLGLPESISRMLKKKTSFIVNFPGIHPPSP